MCTIPGHVWERNEEGVLRWKCEVSKINLAAVTRSRLTLHLKTQSGRDFPLPKPVFDISRLVVHAQHIKTFKWNCAQKGLDWDDMDEILKDIPASTMLFARTLSVLIENNPHRETIRIGTVREREKHWPLTLLRPPPGQDPLYGCSKTRQSTASHSVPTASLVNVSTGSSEDWKIDRYSPRTSISSAWYHFEALGTRRVRR